MDHDASDALDFIRQVIKPKLRAKTIPAFAPSRSTGIMT